WAVSTVNQWTQLALLSIRALCADKFALTVNLENIFRQIDADGRNLHGGRSRSVQVVDVALLSTLAHPCRWVGVHSINATQMCKITFSN
ncbi:hypothetical protein, partial [Paraburkholderia humisilvae]|uniref:hypothetical protein n=1 Tax=Paraburkholderia humisilvae TaxID=627669 RepID=UPI0035EFDC0A